MNHCLRLLAVDKAVQTYVVDPHSPLFGHQGMIAFENVGNSTKIKIMFVSPRSTERNNAQALS